METHELRAAIVAALRARSMTMRALEKVVGAKVSRVAKQLVELGRNAGDGLELVQERGADNALVYSIRPRY